MHNLFLKQQQRSAIRNALLISSGVCVCVYQGVRDLLKDIVDKIQTIPTTVSSAIVQQLLAAREVQYVPLVHLQSGTTCDLFIF